MKKRYIVAIVVFIAVFIGLYQMLDMRKSDRGAIREFKAKGITLTTRTLHIGHSHLHYASVGSDTLPTLVFIHGSPGSWYDLKSYLMDSSLRTRYRLIAIDRPGFGHSDHGQAMHLMPQCDIIASFLDSIKNDRRFYVIGHSLGGSIVPIVAAEKPDIVTGIVILAGAVDPAMEPKEGWREAFTKVPMRYLMPSAFRASNDELWYFKKDVSLIGDKLKQVRCKVYIVHAVNDQLVDVRNADYMKRMMISAEVNATILPEGNHFIPWNHQELIVRLLMGL